MKLLGQYQKLHEEGHFGGMSLMPFVEEIGGLVSEFKSCDLLDYGCGKGLQYKDARAHEAWGVSIPFLYDPAVPGHDVFPHDKKFDGVICTDVLEHVPEKELDAMLRQISDLTLQWAFFSVCCRPSKYVTLPNGRNVHVTLRPFEWWAEKLSAYFGHVHLVIRETK